MRVVPGWSNTAAKHRAASRAMTFVFSIVVGSPLSYMRSRGEWPMRRLGTVAFPQATYVRRNSRSASIRATLIGVFATGVGGDRGLAPDRRTDGRGSSPAGGVDLNDVKRPCRCQRGPEVAGAGVGVTGLAGVVVARNSESCPCRARSTEMASKRAASCGAWKPILFSASMKSR
jgi:hypothetical protein